jgi:hypothetical protein
VRSVVWFRKKKKLKYCVSPRTLFILSFFLREDTGIIGRKRGADLRMQASAARLQGVALRAPDDAAAELPPSPRPAPFGARCRGRRQLLQSSLHGTLQSALHSALHSALRSFRTSNYRKFSS